jgi:hypothetical protein
LVGIIPGSNGQIAVSALSVRRYLQAVMPEASNGGQE